VPTALSYDGFHKGEQNFDQSFKVTSNGLVNQSIDCYITSMQLHLPTKGMGWWWKTSAYASNRQHWCRRMLLQVAELNINLNGYSLDLFA